MQHREHISCLIPDVKRQESISPEHARSMQSQLPLTHYHIIINVVRPAVHANNTIRSQRKGKKIHCYNFKLFETDKRASFESFTYPSLAVSDCHRPCRLNSLSAMPALAAAEAPPALKLRRPRLAVSYPSSLHFARNNLRIHVNLLSLLLIGACPSSCAQSPKTEARKMSVKGLPKRNISLT